MKSTLSAMFSPLVPALCLALFLHPTAHGADAAPRTIKLRTGVDNAVKFDLGTITVARGETVRLVMTNATTLPKAVMGHNWVLLKAGSDPAAFAAAAAPDSASGYIPASQKDKVLASIGVLGPNETGEITFQAPSEPGDYPFLCSFPGHCLMGMKGTLVVKK
jgi:azurin